MSIGLWQLLVLIVVAALVLPLAFRVHRMRDGNGDGDRAGR